MKTVVHMGLHKTATKYFQHFVFPHLPEETFLYNPSLLDQYMMDYLKAEPKDRKCILAFFRKEKRRLDKAHPNKTLVISREILSGNLFSAYKRWDESAKLIKNLFPDAQILISLRFQPDWLLSCYRESLHEHHFQSIERFLCFDTAKRRFFKPERSKNEQGYAQLFALNLDYTRMLKRLFALFTRKRVTVFFYEDFKRDKKGFTARVLKLVGAPNVAPRRSRGIPNRGYSAFAIKLSILRARLLKALGLGFLMHRPIFFFGKGSIPAGKPDLSVLNKRKYWGPQFKRDNEEVRSPNYPHLTFMEKLRMECSWRSFIKRRLDRIHYFDWDILGECRVPLERKYHRMNQKLLKLLLEVDIPEKYLR